MPSEKWHNIQNALVKGLRGLLGESSLAQLLEENRGARNLKNLPDLTTEQILQWADAHHRKTGKWPKSDSGIVLGLSGEKWQNIQSALVIGLRSLSGGSSLPKLLAENRGVRNLRFLPDLTAEKILKWADLHHKRTGQWPNVKSGEVPEDSGQKWAAINGALDTGSRGLPGGSSLAKLLAEKRGLRNSQALPDLTIEQILQWADAHHRETGKWPKRDSGAVLGAPGEKWQNVSSALRLGFRGLPGGSSLAQLIESERNAK